MSTPDPPVETKTPDPSVEEVKNEFEDRWWFPAARPFLNSIRRRDCIMPSFEVALESFLVVYLFTAFGLRRRHTAFRNGTAAALAVPLIYWPCCTAMRKDVAVETVIRSIVKGMTNSG